jgi:hypothetical protein
MSNESYGGRWCRLWKKMFFSFECRSKRRWGIYLGCVLAMGVCVSQCRGASGTSKPGTCFRGVVEGEVRAGSGFVRPIGNGLEVMLEPLASGWILRVMPMGGARPAHDYAELATPPYQSVNPLLISTDFSFRAQDVVAWNPREFRFAADSGTFHRMLTTYDEFARGSSGAEGELAALASKSPDGSLQIVDAHFVPGTADQAKMAAAVASHLNATAHTVEQPADGRATTLGRVTWMRFRISLELPVGFRADPAMRLEHGGCR